MKSVISVTSTLNRLPDGSTEVRIRNNSNLSLAAFAISINYVTRSSANNAPLMVYVDPAIDTFPAISRYVQQTAGPLLRDQEFPVIPEHMERVNRNTGQPRIEQRITTAGIFADGAITGDAVLLSRLMLRRSNMLLAVETTLETRSDAGRGNYRAIS